MSFPVTINATVRGAEQPGKFATFLNGSDRYQVQLAVVGDIADGNWQLVTYKSTDTGATWSAVDASNGPLIFADTLGGLDVTIPYSVAQISSTVLKVYYPDVADGPSMTTFTMGGSPAWSGAHTAAPTPPIGGSGVSGEGSFPLVQVAMGYRALDNSIVVVVVGDQVVLNDVVHSICSFNVYSIGGDSWGSWADLDFVDYSDITTWDLIPCGIVVDASSGRATVFMQQVSRDGPGNRVTITQTSSATIGIPLDAPASGFAQCYGAGGGGGGDDPAPGVRGGGAGAGEYRGGSITLTPGGTLAITVATGGPVRTDASGPSSVATISANSGAKGVDSGVGGVGGSGGSGGSEHNDGGHGGAVGSGTGGGGGGVGGPAGPGQNGTDGGSVDPVIGGVGGTGGDPNFPSGFGANVGGAGGNSGPSNPPNNGGAPSGIGCGGGGQGNGGSTPNAGIGGDGLVVITYTKIRNTHACRIYQQAIKSDSSLGTLTEITQGVFPSRSKAGQPVPISFDCAALGGSVWVAFTGAASTTGRDNISAGSGATADVIAFSFQTFTAGNGGNNVDACPAIALSSGVAYCCYLSAPTGGPLAFLSRADSGSGFGGATSFGTATLPDIRQFGRLQASVLATLPEITFGTPTIASWTIAPPG